MTLGARFCRLLCRALYVLIVCTCPKVNGQVDNGAIVGQITIVRGSFPPDRVKLTLQTSGIVVTEAWTDTEGKFIFHDLPGNLYHVSINEDEYESYQEEVKVNPHISPVNFLSIQLKPKPRAEPSNSRAVLTGANPYLTDLADYEKRFPKKVVKEFERGVSSQADGRTSDAIKHFDAAIKLASDFYPAHNNLGTAYLSQGNFDAAEAEFKVAFQLNKNDTEAYFNLGNVFLLTQRYDDALRIVEEGLRREPTSGFGEFLHGSVYECLRRMPEAERALRDAIRLDPSLARAHLELVNLYLRERRTSDAVAELKYFLK